MGRIYRLGDSNKQLIHFGSFDNYTDLVTQHPTAEVIGTLAYVINSQGTAWLPAGLGGNFYSKGNYVWNGSEWSSNLDEVAEQFAKTDLQYVTDLDNKTTNSIVVEGSEKGLVVLRENGNIAGALLENPQNEYGFILGGLDTDLNLANLGVVGSNIYIGPENLYLGDTAAIPYGYLKLAGTPVEDANGNQFYPVSYQQIEEELYAEEFTDGSNLLLTETFQTLFTSTALVNGYTPPATFEWSFQLQEVNTNRSSVVEFQYLVNGTPTGAVQVTTVGAGTTVTEAGSIELVAGVNAGDTIGVQFRVQDDSQGRETRVRGDLELSLLRLRQLGFGVYALDSVNVIQGAGITVYPTNVGAFVALDASGGNINEILGNSSNYINKTFTFKRLDNSANTITLTPDAGDNIDGKTDPVTIEGQYRAVTITSEDGTGWSIVSEYNEGQDITPQFQLELSKNFSRAGQTTIGLVNQQAGVFERYLEMTFTADRDGEFEVSVFFLWSMNVTNNNFFGRVGIIGGAVNEEIEFIREPKDSGGGGEVLNILQGGNIVGNVNSGTDIKEDAFIRGYVDLVAGVSYTIFLDWAGTAANDEATIYQGNIKVVEVL